MKRSVERIKELLVAFRFKSMPDTQYAVFNNQQLEELLNKLPKDVGELCKIQGFPSRGARVKRFGDAILEIINGEDEEIVKVVPVASQDKTSSTRSSSSIQSVIDASVPEMRYFSK